MKHLMLHLFLFVKRWIVYWGKELTDRYFVKFTNLIQRHYGRNLCSSFVTVDV